MNQALTAQLYSIYLQHQRVNTDTRSIQSGDIFFALKGDNFNGNTYAQQALAAGAILSVVDEPEAAIASNCFLVPNVLEALQQLALHHRKQLQIPVIAITGSNGKTTTKELAHSVLSKKYTTYTTKGNLNNHIGIPLTILGINKADAEMAVIEMGANHLQEIASYCQYTLPTHGLITNCGKAHLEGFGGIEGVRKGKGELFDYLAKHAGTAFVLSDDTYFKDMSAKLDDIIWYGQQQGLVTGNIAASDPLLTVAIQFNGTETITLNTQLVGDYNLPNVLAACTLGYYFGVAVQDIKLAIEGYQPANIRSQMSKIGSNSFIMDAYNANPSSMASAIKNIAAMQHNNKVLLLGAMKEMGESEQKEHEALVELLQQYHWNKVVLVGKEFKDTKHPYLYFETNNEAKTWWQNAAIENALILVKGSRGIKMETVIA